MQALAEHCGASLYNRKGVMHGRMVQLENIKPSILLNGLEDKTVVCITAGRWIRIFR